MKERSWVSTKFSLEEKLEGKSVGIIIIHRHTCRVGSLLRSLRLVRRVSEVDLIMICMRLYECSNRILD